MAMQWWKDISPHFWGEFLGVAFATILFAVASVLWTYFYKNLPPLAAAIGVVVGLVIGLSLSFILRRSPAVPATPESVIVRDEQPLAAPNLSPNEQPVIAPKPEPTATKPTVTYRGWQQQTAFSLLPVLGRLSHTKMRTTLKFVATDRGKEMADAWAEIFKRFGWEIKRNDDTHIFLTKTEFQGVRVRFRPPTDLAGRSTRDAVEYIIGYFLDSAKIKRLKFPNTNEYDYMQIEIGDTPDLPYQL
jgi:hypothetical protein